MKMTTRSIKPIGATITLAGLMLGSVACGNEELEPTAQEAPSTSTQETAPRSDAENSGGHATTNQQVGSTSGGTNQGSQNGAPAPAPSPIPATPLLHPNLTRAILHHVIAPHKRVHPKSSTTWANCRQTSSAGRLRTR